MHTTVFDYLICVNSYILKPQYNCQQECTRWNVSSSLLIIDIMLKVLNIKLYYNCHINLTLTKKTKHWPMNHENEVKVWRTIPGRLVRLTILPYNKYGWPIAYKPKHKNLTLSNEPWKLGQGHIKPARLTHRS